MNMNSPLQLRHSLPSHESVPIDEDRRMGMPKATTNLKREVSHQREKAAFRVLITDRDTMTSNLLATALNRERLLDATAIHPSSLLDSLSTSPAAVVVIGAELNCEARSGFDLATSVARSHPNSAIVMILNASTPNAVINAFRSGARGVFSRENPISDFVGCIDHVRKGFIWAGGQEAAFLVGALRNIPAPEFIAGDAVSSLTARELQVVQYAATGKTNKVIARELFLSEHTVKNYLFRAFDKLGVSSRVELLFLLTFREYRTGQDVAEASPLDELCSA
ncbi:MAG: response regulator transcription factor [Acidobacteriaceae bacterium]